VIRHLDTGEAIPGTPFRNMITTAATGGRLSTLSVVPGSGDLVLPCSHRSRARSTFLQWRGCGDHATVMTHVQQPCPAALRGLGSST
jgi:hypothetical protein